jgi:nitroreductase
MDVIQAMETRQSTRACTEREVSRDDIELILNSASRAPSGVNSQPWRVAVVRGKTKQAISEALLAERQAGNDPNPDYAYYPDTWKEPYRSRRIACGKALYEALGINKEDKTRQLQAWENNYRFFGAPVALLFFVDREMNKGSWLDMGMYIENVMMAAVGLGLATCPQASIAEYPQVVRNILGIEEQFILICGMALGYADPQHPVNQYRLSREPQEIYTTWYG